MISTIVEYVNSYFPTYKTQFYCDNFIKACLVYQFLYVKYFTQKLDINQIIYRLTDARHYLRSKHYRIGRGCVYVVNTPFKESEVLGYLTGIIYWCFHKGVICRSPTTFHNSPKFGEKS